jgi:large subunit ribosomal protein L10
MNRQEKESVIASLKAAIEPASLVIVAEKQGISAAMTLKMRKTVSAVSGNVVVAKNSLAKLAIAQSDYSNLSDALKGSNVILYSHGDPIALAKNLVAFSKECEAFKIKAGAMGSNFFTTEMIKKLAELPSLDHLRSQIMAVIQAPIIQVARTIIEPAAQLARVIQAKVDKG